MIHRARRALQRRDLRVLRYVPALGAAEPDPDTPLTIISSVNVLQWCRGDLGVTIGTGVSAWADQSGNAADYAQGTAANQPTYDAADATLNGQATLTFDGSNDFLSSTISLGSGTFVWLIFKQITWTSSERICGGNAAGTTRLTIRQTTGASPDIQLVGSGAGPANNGAPIDSWRRAEAHFTGSTDDYLKVGSVSVTGTNAGVGSVTVYEIGRSIALNANVSVAEIVICDGLPDAGELAALDTYVTSRYGGGLV